MNPLDIIHDSWKPIVLPLLQSDTIQKLKNDILTNCKYYPEAINIFRVFEMPLQDVKIVILGQDPYHSPNTAIGRAFAVNENSKIPPSLRIIAQEIELEGLKTGFYDSDIEHWRTLESWQEQGVCMLNTALTVESGKAGSHIEYWKDFSKELIMRISTLKPCIWLLWGKYAQSYIPYIKNRFDCDKYTPSEIYKIPLNDMYNYIFTSAHPAAELYSGNGNGGFLQNYHFSKSNTLLKLLNKSEIVW